MDTETTTPIFKKIEFDTSRFHVGEAEKREATEREHYTHLTSKLINRSFIATATLVGPWPLQKIIERYELCTKHAGTMPGDVKWWWLRKSDKTPQPRA